MKKRCIEYFNNNCNNNININNSNFAYNDDITYDDNILIYRSKLNKNEQKLFDSNRKFNYNLTFTISVIYGSIGLIILLLGSFTNWGNQLFFNDLYYFTITFIIGTIIVILFLAYQVYSFNFPEIKRELGSDSQYCPDYWISNTINKNNVINKYINKSNNKNLFNLECKLEYNKGNIPTELLYNNSNLDNKRDYKLNIDNRLYIEIDPNNKDKLFLNDNNSNNKFLDAIATMAGYKYNINTKDVTRTSDDAIKRAEDNLYFTNTIPLLCDRVYPLHLSNLDINFSNENNIHNTNKFRCKYAELTGLPWTDAGCPVNN
jgi:hypothetical protein|tara:strand:- start:1099 stop:2049 length:951 start_codon:yes stop_codon:yes gene_type:complete